MSWATDLQVSKETVGMMINTRFKDPNIGQLNHASNPVVNEISKLDPQSACISKEVSHQLTQLAIDCGDDEGFVKIEEHSFSTARYNTYF